MTNAHCQWSLSNPGPGKLLVWLEPWAEEFELPARSNIALFASTQEEEGVLEDVEWTADNLVLWTGVPGTMRVYVDGALQESASAVVPIPEGMTKRMLNIVFEGQPAARLGGRTFETVERASWWQRVLGRLGL